MAMNCDLGDGVNTKCKGKACGGKIQNNPNRKKDTNSKTLIKKPNKISLNKANPKTKTESSGSKVNNVEAVKTSLDVAKKVEAIKQSLKKNQKSESINDNNVNKIRKTESVKSGIKKENPQDLSGHCLDNNKNRLCNEKVMVKKTHNPTHISLSQDINDDYDEDVGVDDDQSNKEKAVNAHSHIDEILKLDKIGSKEVN